MSPCKISSLSYIHSTTISLLDFEKLLSQIFDFFSLLQHLLVSLLDHMLGLIHRATIPSTATFKQRSKITDAKPHYPPYTPHSSHSTQL